MPFSVSVTWIESKPRCTINDLLKTKGLISSNELKWLELN